MRTRSVGDRLAEVALATRRLRRTPAFTIAAVLLLGIGMPRRAS